MSLESMALNFQWLKVLLNQRHERGLSKFDDVKFYNELMALQLKIFTVTLRSLLLLYEFSNRLHGFKNLGAILWVSQLDVILLL